MAIKRLMNKIFALFFCLFVFYYGSVFAQDTPGHEVISLSLDEVSRLALENNFDVQLAKFDAYIARNDLLEAVSVFDTILTAKASFKSDQLKKSSTIAGSKALTNDYSLGVSKKLPTGTTIGVEVSDTRSATNSSFAAINPSHEALAKVSVNQALGKNFFGLIDRNKIKITRKDIENSEWTSLERIENSLAGVQKAYWKVVMLTEELEITREEYHRARKLYEIYKNKIRFGLIEDPDLFGSEANMLQRQNNVLNVIDRLNSAKDELLLLLNQDSRNIRIKPEDSLRLERDTVDFYEALRLAVENRKDYKIAKNEVEKNSLSLVTKSNSLWPEIDLEASFARNGLTRQYKEAFQQVYNEDNPELFVGVTIKVPLENNSARGQYNKAKLQKARSLVELKKVERTIASEINELVTKAGILAGRVLTQRRVSDLQEKKLQAEVEKFRFGRSSSDVLIRYQEDVLIAKLAYIQFLYDYRLSLIDLKVAENTLLNDIWEGEL